MKKLFIFPILFICVSLHAQTQFFSNVKIEFEKVVYVKQLYQEMEPDWYEQIKDRLPVSTVSYFSFVGDSTKSLFKQSKEAVIDSKNWYRPIADNNVVYTDFKNHKVIAQKPVFEETFLVEDSLAKIKWKITADTRTIAGFDCRKAVGIMDDSIGIYAFYSEELMVNGGPESIHGLPGMILGVSIPRLHTTWFATKVEVFNVNMNAVVPATKGKKVTKSNLSTSLEKVLKNWGTYGSKMIVNFII